MTILVIGATGGVGSAVLAGLAAKGLPVRGMTRYPSNLEKLPAGAEGVVADLTAPGSLINAFKDVEQLFLMTPLSQNEIQAGRNAVAAAKAAGVKRIVHLSVPLPTGAEQIPHYRNKIFIEKALKESGITYSILRPNNFYQNDFWGKAAIMAYGTYPQPIGNVGLSRVDSRDVADAAINALLNDGFENQEFLLNGPDVLTANQIAEIFSAQLGKTIQYGGDDLEAWAKQSQHMMPQWMVSDFKVMYAYFQSHGLIASEETLEKQKAIIGHAPRTFAAFAAEMTGSWSQG